MTPNQSKIRASTQDHLDIDEIRDDLIILKNGCCALVLRTTAINFGLLSEKEQEATIFAYAGFLNSLTFPTQIVIHSRQKDISAYLTLIDQQIAKQPNEKLKLQAQKYRQFVETTVKKNKVLEKDFYIAIPYMSVQFKKGKLDILLEKAKTILYPERDHLISQFQRLGLRAAQLTSQELIELFYNLYNPETEAQKFGTDRDYSATFVQSMQKPPISTPTPPPVTPPPPEKNTSASNPTINTANSDFQPMNPLIPKPVEKKPLSEGSQLQNQIDNIIQKVASQKMTPHGLNPVASLQMEPRTDPAVLSRSSAGAKVQSENVSAKPQEINQPTPISGV